MNDTARRKLHRGRILKLVLTPFIIALFGWILYRAVLYYWAQDYGTLNAVLAHLDGEAISFQAPDGVYDGSVDLALTMHPELPDDARIYYSLDGSDPSPSADSRNGAVSGSTDGTSEKDGPGDDTAAENAEKYFAPVHLTADTQPVTMVTVKACVRWQGENSPVQTHYYLIARDTEVYEALQGLYTAAITAPEEALYDYDTGILADGRFHDEALLQREADPTAPSPAGIGNWSQEGTEWVRAVHLALFDPDGDLLLEQAAGISVSGDVSRKRDPVSLQLTSGDVFEQAFKENLSGIIPGLDEVMSGNSDEETDEEDARFITTLFHTSAEDTLSFVRKYRKLRLRAMNQPGRDIQTPFLFRIAQESGLAGVAPNRRAMVLLNEELHGLADLQPNYTDGWLARRYSLPDSNGIEKYKGSDEEILTQMGIRDLFRADLQKENNRRALEAAVDMDDMLLYYAIEILADNRDWPQKNAEAWRYVSQEIPENNPYADGRVRFLLYDVDNIYKGQSAITTFQIEILTRLMDEESGVFASLMRSETYRDRFLTIVCDLLDTSFRTDHLLNVYDETYLQYRQELRVLEILAPDDLASLDKTVEERRERIAAREEILRSLISSLLLGDRIETGEEEAGSPEEKTGSTENPAGDDIPENEPLISYRVEAPQGVILKWGTRSLTGEGSAVGRYYADCDVTITASPAPGWIWDGWTVNGRPVRTGDPLLSEDGMGLDLGTLLKKSGTFLTVRASVHVPDSPVLVISEVSSKDGRDWVSLRNAGSVPVSLRNYQVFNTRTQAYNDLPDKDLAPGDEIRLCSKQSMLLQVGGGLISFRIREGDGIYLLRRDSAEETGGEKETETEKPASGPVFPHGTAVDYVIVPRMCDGEVYARRRDSSGAVTSDYCFKIAE